MSELLTEAELEALRTSALLADQIYAIVGGNVAPGEATLADVDWDEIASHIHDIQRAIMAQAAARAYPDLFRLLGQPLSRVE